MSVQRWQLDLAVLAKSREEETTRPTLKELAAKLSGGCLLYTSTSAGSAGYWFLQLLDKVTPSQWAAIGVLGSLVFGLLTYLTNLYFKIKEDKRKAARGE